MEPVTGSLSIFALFARADLVVKIVMFLLVAASLWSWAVAIDKWLAFADIEARMNEFERKFRGERAMDPADDRGSDKAGAVMARVYAAAMREWQKSPRLESGARVQMFQDRCERLMQAAIQREMAQAGRGMAVLASVAASAPFIGLFGTVWGIMNSFTAIAANQQTNLAVVAPGIAEALFATALGLAAAVPAVIFFNKLSGDLDRIGDRLDVFADEVSARISRQLSEHA